MDANNTNLQDGGDTSTSIPPSESTVTKRNSCLSLEDNDGATASTFSSRPENTATKRDSYLKSPPYWQRKRSTTQSTNNSLERPQAITLKDNTEEASKSHNHLWAKSITIDDHVVIGGNSPGGIGSYIVWICKVETIDGSPMIIRKRYSEFDELRSRLLKAFPDSTKTSLPLLPPKSAIYKFKPKFLEKRRQGLSYFLNCVMLSPQYASSIIVKDFIFENNDDGQR
ncbi:hypothetical protein H2198_008823 [Neophaeococcomyces mojaviensis]|uniref:Uncharacterized protein n=1 Tax=Neophaeococcomyces mojaviensis TaxID=3383035 RepID=A0ACC2ZWE6_9EURO|nr:hypothetical protein H2198_008823 [Knufia sp. JES_112]